MRKESRINHNSIWFAHFWTNYRPQITFPFEFMKNEITCCASDSLAKCCRYGTKCSRNTRWNNGSAHLCVRANKCEHQRSDWAPTNRISANAYTMRPEKKIEMREIDRTHLFHLLFFVSLAFESVIFNLLVFIFLVLCIFDAHTL